MRSSTIAIFSLLLAYATGANAAANPEAGRQLIMRSCSSCHATEASRTATDGAPPLTVIAKDNKERPAWIRGWLMEPHPPMPSISLSRQQIDDVIAYLRTLSVN
jgi:mono/diheme cytochrome c family protein